MTPRESAQNAVVTDGELERGEHPIGDLVHISTVTHAWRGYLAAVSPSYFILDSARTVVLVDATGEMSSYLKTRAGGRAEDGAEAEGATIRIPRAAVAWMISWAP